MITTDREEFVGSHVTKDVKSELKRRAKEEGTSVSMLIFRLLKKVLGLR